MAKIFAVEPVVDDNIVVVQALFVDRQLVDHYCDIVDPVPTLVAGTVPADIDSLAVVVGEEDVSEYNAAHH